ncbi:putative nuclease HARBI1, partial [Aphis gossypii]|uniref:putative nuclease HARBI1 n=1 Tax=Aphis gossypii TaxID=80765 RepID=UPI0021592209
LNRNHAVTPAQKLLLTLRFYATGSYLISAGDCIGVSKSSACLIVRDVSLTIANLRKEYVRMPDNDFEIRQLQKDFYKTAKFLLVIRAIDCTHVKIQSPGGPNAEYFRNRKGWFSFNVQTVVSSKLKIMDIVVRWSGSTHDSTIFSNSKIYQDLHFTKKWGNSLIVADYGYANTDHVVTPFLNPQLGPENVYNESQIRTRNLVERTYGVWKRRFPILSLGLRFQAHKMQSVIIACSVLHNIAIDKNDQIPYDNSVIQLPEDVLQNIPIIQNNQTNARSRLLNEYFSQL